MRAQRLPDGRIRIPVAVRAADGGLVHGTDDIGPDDPRYVSYDAWLRQEFAADAVRRGVV